MSNIPWLPPLNHPHRSSQTTVKIQQIIMPSSDKPRGYPVLDLFAFADFESDSQDTSTRQKKFHGLHQQFILDDPNICSVNYLVTTCLPSIESDQNRIIFSQKHLDDKEFSSPEPISSSGHELYYKIHSFMINAVAKTGSYNVFFNLVIRMVFTVPDDELKSWHSWYDEKVASDPSFGVEFRLALRRPRTKEELLNEDVQIRRSGSSARFEVVEAAGATGSSCSICLDEFLVGCKVTKLPCGHMFDESCITKWLRENNVCPVCRFDVQNSSIDK